MTVIKVKNSNVAGRLPAAGDLVPAELALNLQDRKLYSKDTAGTVFEIGVAGDVPSGSNPPPSGNNVGDLFFDTDTNKLLYWNGTSWEVVTSEPADGSYVETAGDNMTGNLTLGTDKISLHAGGGTSVFKGSIDNEFGGGNSFRVNTTLEAGCTAYRVKDSESGKSDRFYINGSANEVVTFSVSTDGTADLAGNVLTGGTDSYANIYSAGQINVRNDGDASTTGGLQILRGGNLGSNIVTWLKANGSAEFGSYVEADLFSVSRSSVANKDNFSSKLATNDTAKHFNAKAPDGTTMAAIEPSGDIQSGGRPGTGTPGTRVFASGLIDVCNENGTYAVWRGLTEGSTEETSRINANGSAKFSSTVEALTLQSDPSGGGVISTRSVGGDAAVWRGGDNTFNVDNASTWTSVIDADGSALFKSRVDVAPNGIGTDADYVSIYSYGAVGVRRNTGDADDFLWTGISGTTETSRINKDGSAVFAGTVTANGTILTRNVTLNLDPDNDANYTSTIETYTDTEEYEGPLGRTLTRNVEKTREVKKYTGPTMDVKQTLLDITGALENLKAAAASATTIAELRDAIETSLANV